MCIKWAIMLQIIDITKLLSLFINKNMNDFSGFVPLLIKVKEIERMLLELYIKCIFCSSLQ